MVQPTELKRLRTYLEQRRSELLSLGDVELEAESDGETVHKVDEDSAPLTEMNQVIASNRNRARTDELRSIEAALRRMAKEPDDFGLCEGCEEPIPFKRLSVMPWVRLCIECQQEQESDGMPASRRHITDYRQ